ncbi:DNA polymerase II [Enterovibrio nigricans]|uniref:DNA polymerase n=1 Tax=Enterovibrio nigricans DSM 22720 TaxID=1121868 RepID=A0A1T4UVS3_9GAMM|nr:DNA polymerase II [Enterovibrio nigricans]SKA56746.1 DNA polymerase-2 [Enterovibrio nigricans DSM 22720]
MQYQDGFLISRHSRDIGDRTELVFWVQTPSGPAKLLVHNEKPVFFVAQDVVNDALRVLRSTSIPFTQKSLSLKNFSYQPVSAFYFATIQAANRAARELMAEGIDALESDVRLGDRYLMERFICGGLTFAGDATQRKGYVEYRNVKTKASDYTTSLSRVSLDIECSEKGVLYSIGLDSDMDSRVIMIGEQPENAHETPWIEWVPNELSLLKNLNRWFETFDPDVVVGWSVVDFDFRLLVKRAAFNQIDLRLGRGGEKAHWRDASNSRQGFITLPGRVVIDGIDGLKSATYSFRSWSLESVSQTMFGEGKAIDNPYDRMDSINRMFRDDKVALATYNLQDCVLVNRIFKETHLMEYLIQRSRLTGIELDRIGGSVAAFTNLYLPRLHRGGFVAPTLASENWIASPGGYVMDSKPGLYASVLVLDFKSLYPSIIRTFLIDPQGLIEGLHTKDDTETVPGFRGGVFHREKHFLPSLIELLWRARDEAKRQGEKAFSQAIKIIMNSFYGVLGSSGCRFFDHRLASSITMRGHEIMKMTRELIESQGYNVIYGDTDSTFVSLGKQYSNQDADEIGKALVSLINAWWTQHLIDEYQIDSALEIEYETHYQKFLMPTIRGQDTGSKKRYAGLVDKDGDRRIVYKGLETVRTDWTPLAQEFQQTLYQRVFDGEDIEEYVRNTVEDTLHGNNKEKLVYRKRLRRKLSDYEKNVPPHVKAARKADAYNQKLGRSLQYQHGGWIEYVITTNGAEPLEALESPYDYQHYVDKQLKPIADGILPFIGKRFDELSMPQLGLF